VKRRPFAILALFLAALSAATSAPDAQGPPAAHQATHRQLLPIVQRGYRPPQPCLPLWDQDRLLLAIATEGGLERMAAGDVNGDGWTDAVVARTIWQTPRLFEISVLLNDQQGGLVDGTKDIFDGPVPAVVHPTRILLRDFNGDGRTDIFVSDFGMDAPPFPGGQSVLALSTPSGKLVDATANLPQVLAGPHSSATADIDADGDLDLFLGNLGAAGTPPQIWLNDGRGAFTVAQGLLPPEQEDVFLNWYTACRFADLNNDGAPDLILGQSDPDMYSHVLLNDGTGRFPRVDSSLPHTIFSPNHGAMDIQALDIDGDGYQDLLLVDTRNTAIGRYIQVLINNGDATFRDETATRLTQTYDDGWLRYLELHDLNYDGHMDFVAVEMSGPGPLFYLNRGDGTFSVWEHGMDLYDITFLDIDGDGWRDILNSGPTWDGHPEIHLIHRHLGCRESGP
jgi:hypothetical protein